jgi:hypothetical protein
MGDDDRRLADHQPLQRLLDQQLGLRIDGGRGLVKDQDGRILENRAGNRNALLLSAG